MHVFDELFESSAPALMTVSEASRVLRIGRQLAYDLANEYPGRVVQLCASRTQVGDVDEL